MQSTSGTCRNAGCVSSVIVWRSSSAKLMISINRPRVAHEVAGEKKSNDGTLAQTSLVAAHVAHLPCRTPLRLGSSSVELAFLFINGWAYVNSSSTTAKALDGGQAGRCLGDHATNEKTTNLRIACMALATSISLLRSSSAFTKPPPEPPYHHEILHVAPRAQLRRLVRHVILDLLSSGHNFLLASTSAMAGVLPACLSPSWRKRLLGATRRRLNLNRSNHASSGLLLLDAGRRKQRTHAARGGSTTCM